MIPIRLITGFLGSGKTSLIKNLIRQEQSRKCVYLVNEFSPADVDGVLLAELTPDSLSIPGGSIFCRCLAGQFVSHLQEIPKKFAPAGQTIDELIIEASGIADPRVIFRMLQETGLNRIYRIQSVITIIDPLNFYKLLQTLPNIRSQIEAADTILINKIDCVTAEQVAQTESIVRQINPLVRIFRTTFSRIVLNQIDEVNQPQTLTGEFAPCRDPHFAKLVINHQTLTLERLQSAVSQIAKDIYRLKGFIFAGPELQYVDYSQSGWRTDSAPATVRRAEIAVIVNGENQPKVFDHFKRLGILN